jgi:hypothetical protein
VYWVPASSKAKVWPLPDDKTAEGPQKPKPKRGSCLHSAGGYTRIVSYPTTLADGCWVGWRSWRNWRQCLRVSQSVSYNRDAWVYYFFFQHLRWDLGESDGNSKLAGERKMLKKIGSPKV